MTATTPAHGRSTIPAGCICRWVLRKVDFHDGAYWWQMSERSRHCPLHRWPGEIVSHPGELGMTA